MFIARVVLFRLHESPRYLVHAGRPHDAIESLRRIAEYNGDSLAINVRDVEDRRRASLCLTSREASQTERYFSPRTSIENQTNYQATNISPFTVSVMCSPVDVPDSTRLDVTTETETDPLVSNDAESKPLRRSEAISPSQASQLPSNQSTTVKPYFLRYFPKPLERPLAAWLDRLSLVLSKEWRRTTLLMWCIWFCLSLG